MIDEMMLVFDSPGSTSSVFIIDPQIQKSDKLREGQTRATNNGSVPRGVFCALCHALRTGWLRSPSRRYPAAASLSHESARSMPIPNRE